MVAKVVVAKVVVVIRSWLRAQVATLEVAVIPAAVATLEVVEPTLEVELIRLRVLAKVLEARVMAMDLDRELAKA